MTRERPTSSVDGVGISKDDKCESKPFLPRLIAMVCDDATFEVYDAARTRVAEKKIVEEAEERRARWRRRVKRRRERRKRLRSAREHVIEKILNVSCTRCAQAFCDFSGCFALKCSRCNAGISRIAPPTSASTRRAHRALSCGERGFSVASEGKGWQR